jgi:hypothetical protein
VSDRPLLRTLFELDAEQSELPDRGMKPLSPFCHSRCSRRQFVCTLAASGLLPKFSFGAGTSEDQPVKPCGPAASYQPRIHAAFVRRRGEYGMLWPGAIYDGDQARRDYGLALQASVKQLGLQLSMRLEPIYSLAEGEAWLGEAQSQKPDGLLLLLLDRQQHAWPTAYKAADTGIPTVVFSPVGTSFTTNTESLAQRQGVFIASTSDFAQAHFGLKMLRARALLREMRFVVLQGNERKDSRVPHFGTHLRHVPAQEFLTEYNRLAVNAAIERMADSYLREARTVRGATRQDVVAGVRSYLVASRFLQREGGDGITMDCLGALGQTKVSLPCIAWSRMLDDGIPAACEADIGAALTHALVQWLFDRPGFQQDPVAETQRDCLIGAHCSCATRLNGFDQAPEPFDIVHHHGNRDAVPRTQWRVGQRITIADVIPPNERADQEPARARMVIGTGTVVENVSVPPAGGCVVSVMVRMDGQPDLLAYPGFHQLFFYGDFRKELLAYCRLDGIVPVLG